MLPDITIDVSRHSTVLDDLDAFLTRAELSVLTGMLRRASQDSRTIAMMGKYRADHQSRVAMSTDLLLLRLEVRAVFLTRLARDA